MNHKLGASLENNLLIPARIDDLEFVSHCAKLAYAIYVERIGRPPAPMVADFEQALNSQSLEIICRKDIKVGFLVSCFRGDHLFVENVAIHPDYQNQGIARDVFCQLEKRCHQLGISTIKLYTNEKMTENLAYYPKLGFVETDRRNDSGFNRVYFQKAL